MTDPKTKSQIAREYAEKHGIPVVTLPLRGIERPQVYITLGGGQVLILRENPTRITLGTLHYGTIEAEMQLCMGSKQAISNLQSYLEQLKTLVPDT